MINTLLIYDNLDADLGDFFDQCALYTRNFTNESYNIIELNNNNLNELNFQLKTSLFNTDNFLCISYTHGSETELLSLARIPFLSEQININAVQNSFAYCFACHAGKQLGYSMVNNGALAFVGFKDELKIQVFFYAFDRFISCATAGIKYFFSGMSIYDSVIKMKNEYTTCIDDFYEIDLIVASCFMEHRDALVILGNPNLQITDFHQS
jgi:hypothetical protein